MKFKWNLALAALATSGALVALFAGLECITRKNLIGAIIAAIVLCGCVFAAAGLFGGMEE